MAFPDQTTIALADSYFVATPRNAEWLAVVDQQVWLNEAFRLLNALCYDASKDCCGKSLDDAWLSANSELALALSKNPNAIIGAPSAGGITGAVKRNKLGDLEQEFFDVKDGQAASGRYGPDAPIVLQRFEWLGDMLGCWLTISKTSGTRVIARVRS